MVKPYIRRRALTWMTLLVMTASPSLFFQKTRHSSGPRRVPSPRKKSSAPSANAPSVRVPLPAPKAPEPSAVYTVRQGDTLWGIARRFRTSVHLLAAANHINDPSRILPGQVLHLVRRGLASRGAVVTDLGVELAAAAQRLVGSPYLWGGVSPHGFDCSGLVQYVAVLNGISIPRDSFQQYDVGSPVSLLNLQPGDIVFFTTYTAGPSHDGIYIGGRRFISADSGTGKVVVNSLRQGYWAARYYGARRIVPTS